MLCVLVCSPVAPVPIYQDPDLKQPTPHDKKADIAVSALQSNHRQPPLP